MKYLKIFTISLFTILALAAVGSVLKAQKNIIIKLNDKPLKIEVIEINGKIWVPLEDFCESIGARYRHDKEKDVIYVNTLVRPQSSPSLAETEKIVNRYFFNLSYTTGNFKMDIYLNKKYIGSYNGEADVEITKHLKKGKNELKAVYNFGGGQAGFYFALQERSESRERTTLDEMDVIYAEESSMPTSGEKVFNFEAR